MSDKPSDLPSWATTGQKAEPSSGKKASGWTNGEAPPHDQFNWWQNLVYKWLSWINDFFSSPDSESLELRGIGATADDTDGGSIIVSGGVGQGTGGSQVEIKAAVGGASGSAARNPETFMTIGGASSEVAVSKPITVTEKVTVIHSDDDTFKAAIEGRGGTGGIYGESFSPSYAGVHGVGYASLGGPGVRGVAGAGGDGAGVEGQGQDAGPGVTGAGGSTGNGVEGYTEGVGSGVKGTAESGSSGPGVEGVSEGTGPGVKGDASGGGNAIEGVATGAYGVFAESDFSSPTHSPLYVKPQQSTPSSFAEGGICADSGRKALMYTNGAGWERISRIKRSDHDDLGLSVDGTIIGSMDAVALREGDRISVRVGVRSDGTGSGASSVGLYINSQSVPLGLMGVTGSSFSVFTFELFVHNQVGLNADLKGSFISDLTPSHSFVDKAIDLSGDLTLQLIFNHSGSEPPLEEYYWTMEVN